MANRSSKCSICAGPNSRNIRDFGRCGKALGHFEELDLDNFSPAQQQVLNLLNQYTEYEHENRDSKDLLVAFAQQYENCCERTLTLGHFTGSCWLVSKDGKRVPLTHHKNWSAGCSWVAMLTVIAIWPRWLCAKQRKSPD